MLYPLDIDLIISNWERKCILYLPSYLKWIIFNYQNHVIKLDFYDEKYITLTQNKYNGFINYDVTTVTFSNCILTLMSDRRLNVYDMLTLELNNSKNQIHEFDIGIVSKTDILRLNDYVEFNLSNGDGFVLYHTGYIEEFDGHGETNEADYLQFYGGESLLTNDIFDIQLQIINDTTIMFSKDNEMIGSIHVKRGIQNYFCFFSFRAKNGTSGVIKYW